MRILLVSKFLHHVGGVETYMRWLAKSLSIEGHTVGVFGMEPPDGHEIMDFGDDAFVAFSPFRSFSGDTSVRWRSAAASVYSPSVERTFRQCIEQFRPDIVHFHCTCYQLTPAIFRVVAKSNLPSVMTAHEYKLVCSNQILYDQRLGSVCCDCVGRHSAAKSIAMMKRGCIKGSSAATLLGALETPIANKLWRATGGTAIAPSRFLERLLRQDGYSQVSYLDLPWDAIDTKPHSGGINVVYLGRLERHKGIFTLLRAWSNVEKDLPHASRLRVAGTGDSEDAARELASELGARRVDFLGYLNRDRISEELRNASMTVHPAEWYENSPYSVRESLTHGVPALVSAIGGAPELIDDRTGQTVPPADIAKWSTAIQSELGMRRAGTPALRAAVSERATTESDHLAQLVEVYRGKLDS